MDREVQLSTASRARELVRGHLDVFGEQLIQAVAAELEKNDSAWEAQVKELKEQNERAQVELISQSVGAYDVADFARQPTLLAHGRTNTRSSSKASSCAMGPKPSCPRRAGTAYGFVRLAEKFDELDVENTGVVKVSSLTEKLIHLVDANTAPALEKISGLLAALREANPELCYGLNDDEVSYELFKELMLGKNLDQLDAEHVSILNTFRSIFVQDAALGVVARATNTTPEELNSVKRWMSTDRLFWLEPTIGFVIIANAAVIGLSLDMASNSNGWYLIEIACTLAFVMELALKLLAYGPSEHFFGFDWRWNIFDFVLVLFAVLDLVVSLHAKFHGGEVPSGLGLRDVSMLRIMRVLRLARLARLFKLKYMRELTLMAVGIIGGLRTLFWAFVLLFVVVYILGILSHQLMSDWKTRTPCDESSVNCDMYESNLYDCHQELFGDLFKTCFTVFRCVTGDCYFPDGTPIAPTLMETQGTSITVGYTMSYLFVTVCVFNLIMAVIVEHTLEYAKQDQQKVQHARQRMQAQTALKLQQFVDKIVSHARRPSKIRRARIFQRYRKYLPRLGSADPSDAGYEVDLPTPFKVDRDTFDAAMADPEAQDLLDALEVSTTSRRRLFDILDSNGNGELDIQEIVDGILRLRVPADKHDAVSNGLMIRALQRSVAEMKCAIDQLQIVDQPADTPTQSCANPAAVRAVSGGVEKPPLVHVL